MISVSDLLKWADEHAIGRSASYPRGWISGKDLQMLSIQIEQNEPLNFYYSVGSNLPEEVYGQYTDTAGNFHWCGTHSGEHTIKAEES
jgi:hypothetical protein